jgi:alkylhydroperoxidase/carboxymuconolactone decarboxylase family protein YurZ
MQDLDKRDLAARFADGAKTRSELTRGRAPLADPQTVSDFSRPFRELMGASLFNDIWNRPGLARRDRCLIALGILATHHRLEELKHYLGLALDVGVTRDEIQEVLLQCVVYCGTLAGTGAFQVAEQVFAERDRAARPES